MSVQKPAEAVVAMQNRQREGMPQGSPLSPLLSNLLLTDLDRELERRGRWFAVMQRATEESPRAPRTVITAGVA